MYIDHMQTYIIKYAKTWRKRKGEKRSRMSHLLKNLLQTLLGKGNPLRGVKYAMRIIGQEIVHIKLKLRNSLRVQKP